MKRFVCICLALVLCLLSVPAARALDDRAWDASRIKNAVAMTAQMAGNAIDQAGTVKSRLESHYVDQFAETPFLAPDRAVVLEFNEDQITSSLTALGIRDKEAWEDTAPAIADLINGRFSKEYGQAARRVQAESSAALGGFRGYYMLVLLAYGEDISITSLVGYRAVSSRSSFIISTQEINEHLGTADVNQYVQALGIDAPLVRVYDRTELDALMEEFPWFAGSALEVLADAMLSSQKRKDAMLPAWLAPDSPHISDDMRYAMVIPTLCSIKTADLATLRMVVEHWMPLGPTDDKDPVDAFLNRTNNVVSNHHIDPPKVKYGEELHKTALKEDGTFLVVFQRNVPGKKAETWIDPFLEAVLPLDAIPETVKDADYIIRCSITYEGGTSKGKIHLHYPLTHVTVHDARTGEMLRDLGKVKRTLTGTVALPEGDTWWDPLYTHVWSKIRVLFERTI